MNAERKQKWINALLSGNYQQARGYLRAEDKYCCLGVLCDIVQKETEQGEWREGGFWYHGLNNLKMPSGDLLSHLELEVEMARMLAANNDAGSKFSDIAKMIRTMPVESNV